MNEIKAYKRIVITTVILFALPFIFYAVERSLGVLPSQDEWWKQGINHGPWTQDLDSGGRGLGFESILVGNLLLLLSVITFIVAVVKSVKSKSFRFLVAGILLAISQFGLAVLQLYLLIWTVD
ncbi:MAG: hypothetical protein Q7S50_03190 [bacterium]|nr:hypothetical protein [bacterium]